MFNLDERNITLDLKTECRVFFTLFLLVVDNNLYNYNVGRDLNFNKLNDNNVVARFLTSIKHINNIKHMWDVLSR